MPVTIAIHPAGPVKVSGAKSVRFCGESIPVEGDLYLCRCGDSANAPYCDGAHSRGFDGTYAPPAEQEMRVWEGRTLRTYFNRAACMHVYYCKPLNELRERELAGDDAAAAEIARVVGTCPSGALSVEPKGDVALPAPAEPNACIDIIEGGEVRLQVPFEINAPLNDRQATDRGTLCRCGRSKNKPWCDGRHKGRKGFR